MFSLAGKGALVTGAGSGIGAAIAKNLATAGASVVIADRDATGAEATVAAITATGGKARSILLDVTDEAACAALPAALAAWPTIDILVNNAGIGHVGTVITTAAADLDRMWSVNVRGVFNLSKIFVPGMVERKRGSVIMMASIGGVVGVRDRFAYTTTKFAVVGMTKAMALDHSHSGVRFNAICPGRVETPFVAKRIAEYADPVQAHKDMSSTQLNGRMVMPDEVGAAALYLASDEASMVTGSTFLIDGGWSAGK